MKIESYIFEKGKMVKMKEKSDFQIWYEEEKQKQHESRLELIDSIAERIFIATTFFFLALMVAAIIKL